MSLASIHRRHVPVVKRQTQGRHARVLVLFGSCPRVITPVALRLFFSSVCPVLFPFHELFPQVLGGSSCCQGLLTIEAMCAPPTLPVPRWLCTPVSEPVAVPQREARRWPRDEIRCAYETLSQSPVPECPAVNSAVHGEWCPYCCFPSRIKLPRGPLSSTWHNDLRLTYSR